MATVYHTERFQDATHQVDVIWHPMVEPAAAAPAIQRFHQIVTSVAGEPPALETFDPANVDLLAFHVVAINDPDPAYWRFVLRGWTGLDARSWLCLGDVESDAVRAQAISGYLRSAYTGPTMARIERRAKGVQPLSYTRLCAPQTDRLYGRPYFLWIGMALEP